MHYICMYVHAHVQLKKVVCMYGVICIFCSYIRRFSWEIPPTLGAAEASRGGWASDVN